MLNIDLNKLYKEKKAKPNETLLEHTDLVLGELNRLKELEYIKDERIIKLLEISCRYHDFGKINKFFQNRIEKNERFNDRVEVGHNILSAYLVHLFINEMGEEDKNIIRNSILNHHKYINNYDYLRDFQELIRNNLQDLNNEIFNLEEKTFKKVVIRGLKERIHSDLIEGRVNPDYILVKGLLHKCDYSASAHNPSEIKNDFLTERLNNLGYQWRDIQNYCSLHKDKNILITGSTGLGKTEASLLWGGDNKIFYVLPLRTAINAMYKRIKSQIVPEDYGEKLGLLHGDTISVYLKEEQKSNTIKSDNKQEELEEVKVQENEKFYEYYDLTRSMSLPITIATPDQLFDFVFKYPGYELKLSTYSYSKIIVDEIQAYSPDILAYTIYALKQISKMGGKFSIFTATLAPFVKELLFDENNIEYLEEEFLMDKKRHYMKLIESSISADYVYDVFNELQIEGDFSWLIVMNTIKDAQKIFLDLKDLLGEEDVEIKLLHSKYTVKDRAEKELQILIDGDKENNSDKRNKRVIWVTTQIVEASLDIDFDMLFTELSELLGLFQRFGRCFRKREYRLQIPNVHVFTEISDNLINDGKKGFIDRGLHELSKKALLEKGDGIIVEKEKVDMINEYFTTEKINSVKGSRYFEEYDEIYEFISKLKPETLEESDANRMFRNIISFKAIPKSIYEMSDGSLNPLITEILENIKSISNNIKNSVDKKTRSNLRLELIKEKNKLNEYTLNIEKYILDHSYLLPNYEEEKIYICKYKYDSELGLTKDKEDDSQEPLIW